MKLKKPFEVTADDFHFNGHSLLFPAIKDEQQVVDIIAEYCSLETIIREVLGRGHKVEEILAIAKKFSEDFEKPVTSNSNIPGVFVKIFEQFNFPKAS